MASAQNNPITFTEQEQIDLRQLEQNLELFGLLKGLLTQGTFPGSASVALIRCQQLAENLIANTAKQAEEVRKAATERSAAPKADTKVEGKKKDGKAQGN